LTAQCPLDIAKIRVIVFQRIIDCLQSLLQLIDLTIDIRGFLLQAIALRSESIARTLQTVVISWVISADSR
jgi:hypothetical protein